MSGEPQGQSSEPFGTSTSVFSTIGPLTPGRSDWSMLLRVAVLSLFGALAAFGPDLAHPDHARLGQTWSNWVWLALGYGLSVLAAWWWDKQSNPDYAGWIQLGVDTILAAVVVQLSGGLDSEFALLYLVAIAASASHGSPQQCWGSLGACAMTYGSLSALELLSWIDVVYPTHREPRLVGQLLTVGKNLGAMLAITLFAVRLTRMWQRSENARIVAETRQAQGRNKILELQKDLEHSERMAAIGQLAATVAHEIRNPLAAMSGCVEVLGLPLEAAERTRVLEIIDREIRRLDSTVQQLLDYARPGARPKHEDDLVRVVQEVIEAFSQDPSRAKLAVTYRGSDEATGVFERESISQLLWNLLHNAAQAQQNEGEILVHAGHDDQRLELSVTDQGGGIDPDLHDKIFEPYYTTKSEGSGFGLAVVAQIVEGHGGSIEILPSDKGSCFKIQWPRRPNNESAEPVVNSPAAQTPRTAA